MTLLEQISATPWEQFAQPSWNRVDSVPRALEQVLCARDVESCTVAVNAIMKAVANNHAGTYYPVLIVAMPLLAEIVCESGDWPQRAVLCLLDDLLASFHPEQGYEQISDPVSGVLSVESAFRRHMESLRPILTRLAVLEGNNSALAKEMLSVFPSPLAGEG